MHSAAALFLYEKTLDPMLLDSIRVLNDPKTAEKQRKMVKNYVEFKFSAYLNLYSNGGIDLPYGLQYDQFDPSSEPE